MLDIDHLVKRSPWTAMACGTIRWIIAAAAVLLLAASGCGNISAAPGTDADPSGNECILCRGGNVSCGPPGTDRCPGQSQNDPLPICGELQGYAITNQSCGGTKINGLPCVTRCKWELGSDPAGEILDAGTITIPPGCTLPVDAGSAVCVVNCSDCR